MSTYNVYIGEYLIMENVPGQDVKDKMEHIRDFFNHFPYDLTVFDSRYIINFPVEIHSFLTEL